MASLGDVGVGGTRFVQIGDSADCHTGRAAGLQESGQQLTLDPCQLSDVVKLWGHCWDIAKSKTVTELCLNLVPVRRENILPEVSEDEPRILPRTTQCGIRSDKKCGIERLWRSCLMRCISAGVLNLKKTV